MGKKKKPDKRTKIRKPIRTGAKPLDDRVMYGVLFLFIALAFILYHQCIPYGYVLDDKIVISDNSYTKEGIDGIWKILTTESFEGYFGEQKNLLQGGRYRPLSIVTFALEYEMWGLKPSASHIVNILLYGLSVFLAFISLRQLFGEKTYRKKALLSLSFLAALVYLVHPIHTEAIANIKGRDEIMAFAFSILTLLFATKYFDTRHKHNFGLMVLFYFLGLLSKENTITFLAIVPFGIWLFRRSGVKVLAAILGGLFATTIVYLVIRFQVIGFLINEIPSNDIMNNPFVGMNAGERLATVLYTLLLYIKLSIFPHPLTHDYYPYHIPIMNFKSALVWLSIVVHLLMAGAVFYYWKKRPKVSFALGFYLAAMSIVSNLFVDVGTFMNERFAFTASLGICILLVYLFRQITKKYASGNARVLIILVALLALPFAIKTYTRVPVWESALTLNSAAIKVSKNSARANSFMSTALFEEYKVTTDRQKRQELLDAAEPYTMKALSIYPDYFNANLMRAGIAAEQYKLNGDLDRLLSEFIEIIKVRPDVSFITEYLDYLNGRADAQRLTQFYINAGRTIMNQGKNLTWAVHYLLMGYNQNPSNTELRALLAQAYEMIGRPDEAAKYR